MCDCEESEPFTKAFIRRSEEERLRIIGQLLEYGDELARLLSDDTLAQWKSMPQPAEPRHLGHLMLENRYGER